MIVNMPVEAYSEKCIKCPKLEIDILTKEEYKIQKIDEDGTTHQVNNYTNTMRCAHFAECSEIFRIINEVEETKSKEQKEIKKVVKKTPTKKPVAKKVTTKTTKTK